MGMNMGFRPTDCPHYGGVGYSNLSFPARADKS